MAQTLIGPDPYSLTDASENGNTLLVKKNVSISAGAGNAVALTSGASDVVVKVKGQVETANGHGILLNAAGSDVVVANTGSVAGGSFGFGVLMGSTGHTSLTNNGLISGHAGVSLNGGTSDIANHGTIQAYGSYGFGINTFSGPVSILNTGEIYSSYGGIQVTSGGTSVVNEGLIVAPIGVVIAHDTSTFENTGEIHAARTGLYLGTVAEATAENAGTIISAGQAVYATSGVTFLNTGVLKGEDGVFNISSGQLHLTNRGKIVGDVEMSDNNDTLTQTGKGTIKGRVSAGDGADILTGNSKKDVFFGQDDSDVLIGGGGKDRLSGGHGFDDLDGGSGNDILRGGEGEDLIKGNKGNDILIGGNAGDTFIFAGNRPGDDVIRDFLIAQDEIDLSDYALNAGEIDALFDAIHYGKNRTVIDLSGLDGVQGSITLEGYFTDLLETTFIFS